MNKKIQKPAGPTVYYCMAPGCKEYGTHGFYFGKLRYCGGHKELGLTQPPPITHDDVAPAAQGRLL